VGLQAWLGQVIVLQRGERVETHHTCKVAVEFGKGGVAGDARNRTMKCKISVNEGLAGLMIVLFAALFEKIAKQRNISFAAVGCGKPCGFRL